MTRILLVSLLAALTAGVFLWIKVDRKTEQLLQPVNPAYRGYSDLPDKTQGVQLSPFSLTGKDGHRIQACLVRASSEKDTTPRQQALLDRLHNHIPDRLQDIDFVLMCSDWDHSIRSTLPLAEQFAAAGITCVLWEPRGSMSSRPYCTHGVRESEDVPLIINALEELTGRKDLMILGVGQRFGAELMLHAAVSDPRLRAIAAIDTRASLGNRIKRSGASLFIRELIGWRMKALTNLEPFDIAAVQSLFHLPRHVPVLLAYSREDDPDSLPEDSIALYTQLHPEQRSLITPRTDKDAPDATTRDVAYTQRGGTHDVQQHAEATLLQDVDDIPAQILLWMHDKLPALQELPTDAPAIKS